MSSVRATVWNEFRHEKKVEAIAEIYPEGIYLVGACSAWGSQR